MNLNQSFPGQYLKKLYTKNKLNDYLLTHENLRTLLNYELDHLDDEADSHSSFEVIDFCVEKLREMEPADEQKLDFLGQKLALEARELDRQDKAKKRRRRVVAAAAAIVIGGGIVMAGTDGFAGKFDLVHRLLYQEKGEQLAMATPDVTLTEVEYEPGHLPETIPEEYTYTEKEQENSDLLTFYRYYFKNLEGKKLTIAIRNYKTQDSINQIEQEMDENSFKKESVEHNTYYYMDNKDLHSISWAYKKNIYTISGIFPFEKLEEILTLYREEQNEQ